MEITGSRKLEESQRDRRIRMDDAGKIGICVVHEKNRLRIIILSGFN